MIKEFIFYKEQFLKFLSHMTLKSLKNTTPMFSNASNFFFYSSYMYIRHNGFDPCITRFVLFGISYPCFNNFAGFVLREQQIWNSKTLICQRGYRFVSNVMFRDVNGVRIHSVTLRLQDQEVVSVVPRIDFRYFGISKWDHKGYIYFFQKVGVTTT